MDVGGGHGELLSRCLALASQDCKGVLLDREMVLKGIDIPGTFEAKGVKRAAERLTFVAADVRQPFPQQVKDAQPDALLMKHFLSAFSDEDSVAIVTHCRQVLAPQGRVLLLQTLVPEPGDKAHNTCEDGVAPGLFAIEILAQCPGGAWRTLSEWRAIFEKAGMQLDSAEDVGCNMNLMIWKAAGGQ
jgi:SAM-dependent methyltransferase